MSPASSKRLKKLTVDIPLTLDDEEFDDKKKKRGRPTLKSQTPKLKSKQISNKEETFIMPTRRSSKSASTTPLPKPNKKRNLFNLWQL